MQQEAFSLDPAQRGGDGHALEAERKGVEYCKIVARYPGDPGHEKLKQCVAEFRDMMLTGFYRSADGYEIVLLRAKENIRLAPHRKQAIDVVVDYVLEHPHYVLDQQKPVHMLPLLSFIERYYFQRSDCAS
jgi:hypothetical protein